MSLKDYRFQKTKVTDDITVRGLSMVDVMAITKEHFAVIKSIFEQIERGPDQAIEMRQVIGKFAPTTPQLAASIIALGCDEPESVEIAARLPLGIQIESIHAIGQLTFATQGGARAVFQMVMDTVNSLNAPMTATRLQNGSGESAGKFPS